MACCDGSVHTVSFDLDERLPPTDLDLEVIAGPLSVDHGVLDGHEDDPCPGAMGERERVVDRTPGIMGAVHGDDQAMRHRRPPLDLTAGVS